MSTILVTLIMAACTFAYFTIGVGVVTVYRQAERYHHDPRFEIQLLFFWPVAVIMVLFLAAFLFLERLVKRFRRAIRRCLP